MPRITAALAAAIFSLFIVIAPALGATTGLVRGTITVDGKPRAGTSVILEGEGSRFSTTTGAKGHYVFAQVPFGTYRVVAQAKGAHELQTIVTVASDQVATINLDLSTQLKQIEHVAVTAHEGVETNPPSVHQIDRNTIAASPVNNSLNRLIETLPGVVQFSYNEPVINGFHGVTYNIDGAPLPLSTTSNFAEIIDPKDVDSVEVLTGAIPAEYGGDRMGGVVNIISSRPSDIPQGTFGTVTGGFGSQGQAIGSFDLASHAGSSDIFLSTNTERTDRGIDAPTFTPINDASSDNDQFLHFITQMNQRDSLAFDYSNQFSQFQIPINTDPNNPYDPIVDAPGTLDTQLEYERFANLNFTAISKDGNGVFQIIPWWRSTRINYDGDLPLDVLGTQPTSSASSSSAPAVIHNVGLQQGSYAAYVGIRASDFRATKKHAWKVGVDLNRENATSNTLFACYNLDCTPGNAAVKPYYAAVTAPQAQAGSQVGIYAEDKWQMSPNIVWNYGLRYDASTGYTGGNQISPRVGVNVWDGGRNVVHAYYGRFYAAPLLEDVRQACVVLTGACTTTHPAYDLQPERDAYFEMGIKHAFGPFFTGSLNVFQKSVVNILDTTQLLNTPVFAVYNNAIGIDHGAEVHLQRDVPGGDQWFLSGTYSASYAACISGSTFLFPPNPAGVSCVAQLALEDHSQYVDATAGYTHRFGFGRLWYGSLQADYGSGFPVFFQSATQNLNGLLPAHTTLALSLGRDLRLGEGPQSRGLGLSLQVLNLLNHQYPIKVANGFNTTQIANGRSVLFRVTAPF
jgi:outer membrane receptor protein involved in Fe transport